MNPVARASAEEIRRRFEQEIARLASLAPVRSAIAWFRGEESRFTRWQLEVAEIPAPPFGEAARAEWLQERFRELELEDVHQDSLGSVFGLRRAAGREMVSISAHLDTVFPPSTPLAIRQEGGKLSGPGISDNAAGVTALLATAAAFRRFQLPHSASLLFIGNVGEEGEGDLRGMRHIFCHSEWKDRISSSLVLDGAGSDTIVSEALGSRRFEVVIRGPGGHSWSDFGAPNPIVVLGRAIHRFSETRVSSSPKTTFNIGVVRGGTSVNSIPESASMRVDVRSTSAIEIERVELELRRSVAQSVQEEAARTGGGRNAPRASGLSWEILEIGNRPAGELPPQARILDVVRAVDRCLGNNSHIQRASTDANIPISMGREAIAIGAGGRGGGAHTLAEWFDPAGRDLGLARILLIVLALAGAGA